MVGEKIAGEEALEALGWHFNTLQEVPEETRESVIEWAEQYDEVMDDLNVLDENAAYLLLDLCKALAAAGTVQGACVSLEDGEKFERFIYTHLSFSKLLLEYGYAKNCFAELCWNQISDDGTYATRHEKVRKLLSEHFADFLR